MAQNKTKLFGLISAGLFLLVGIFSFLKIFTAKISFFGVSESIGCSLLEMKEVTPLATIAVILLALVAVAGLACALLGKYKFAMIAAAVELVLFIIVFFVVKGKINSMISSMMSKELGGMGELAGLGKLASSALSVHISFLGWLHMIFTVAAGALAFLAGKKEAV